MKTYTINYMNVITKTEHQDIHMALAQFIAEVMAGGDGIEVLSSISDGEKEAHGLTGYWNNGILDYSRPFTIVEEWDVYLKEWIRNVCGNVLFVYVDGYRWRIYNIKI